MSYKHLFCQKTGNVMIINITDPVNRTDKVALLSDELSEMSTEITWDEEIRVILLADQGNLFDRRACFNEQRRRAEDKHSVPC